jgi:hypothetical protein
MIENNARKAPIKLAITSKTSALLVVVKYSCINSMVIPNTNEQITEKAKSRKLLNFTHLFLKYKNQSVVNTK